MNVMNKDIWIVDDDPIFRYIIRNMINHTEFKDRVEYFDDGDRAILKLVELNRSGGHGPAVMFLDLSMKHLDGWQLLDLLNEFETDIKVVILTSSVSLRDRVRAEQEPRVYNFLTKPVDRSKILEVLEGLAAA